jgi:hypothetical protein
MVILQAAIGLGILMIIIFGSFIFLGIPLLANIFIGVLTKRKVPQHKNAKIIIWFEGLLIATVVICVVLYVIWKLFLSRVDLTYS